MKDMKDILNKNPFRVPDKYFEEINRKIISETAGYDHEAKKNTITRSLKSYLAIAAMFIGIVLLSYTAVRMVLNNKTNSGLAEITMNEINESCLNDIDILVLEENAAYINPEEEKIDVNNNDIIDYLILDNINLYDIYEQL
jgi:hypothetical protein